MSTISCLKAPVNAYKWDNSNLTSVSIHVFKKCSKWRKNPFTKTILKISYFFAATQYFMPKTSCPFYIVSCHTKRIFWTYILICTFQLDRIRILLPGQQWKTDPLYTKHIWFGSVSDHIMDPDPQNKKIDKTHRINPIQQW